MYPSKIVDLPPSKMPLKKIRKHVPNMSLAAPAAPELDSQLRDHSRPGFLGDLKGIYMDIRYAKGETWINWVYCVDLYGYDMDLDGIL